MKDYGAVDTCSSEQQFFVKSMWLHLLCEKSGAIHLAQPGLMAGWLANLIGVNFDILKFAPDQHFKLFDAFNKVIALLNGIFWKKPGC